MTTRAAVRTGLIVVLVAALATGVTPAAKATLPAPIDLGATSSSPSAATAVDGNLVVGYATTTTVVGDTQTSYERAFLYDLGATTPTMVDLGTLPGDNRSEAVAVSGNMIVGNSYSALSSARHGFFYDLAATTPTMVGLGVLPGYDYSEAVAVSGNVVVGNLRSVATGARHAFAYDLSGNTTPPMTDLGELGGGVSVAAAVSGDVVVGQSFTEDREVHAFAYDLSGNTTPPMTDLGTLGGPDSEATAVSGTLVVGQSRLVAGGAIHPFAYDLSGNTSPPMTDLGTLGGHDSRANAVSGDVVVGYSETTDSVRHPFAYDLAATTPTIVDLGTFGGLGEAVAVSGDLVVGFSYLAGNQTRRAFVYDLSEGTPAMADLGDLGGPGSDATAMSGGLVVGSSYTASPFEGHAVAWQLTSPEVCDTVDNDGDGQIDEGVTTTFHRDADGDSYGNAAVTANGCSAPSGYVADDDDCDDSAAAVNPAASETFNAVDDDCDGQIDEGFVAFYPDTDSDTFGAGPPTYETSAPVGFVANDGDCDDTTATVKPGAPEIQNAVDDDCDGVVDEFFSTTTYTGSTSGYVLKKAAKVTFSAVVASSTKACLSGRSVTFTLDRSPVDGSSPYPIGSATTSARGVATLTVPTSGWTSAGVYSVTASIPDLAGCVGSTSAGDVLTLNLEKVKGKP